MKKQFLNLGKALSKAEQKQVFGGLRGITEFCDGSIVYLCDSSLDCGWIVDPLSGAQMVGVCQVWACGTRCFYTLD